MSELCELVIDARRNDEAAVITTKLMIPAPAGIPIFSKTKTNGLVSGLNRFRATRDMMISRAPIYLLGADGQRFDACQRDRRALRPCARRRVSGHEPLTAAVEDQAANAHRSQIFGNRQTASTRSAPSAIRRSPPVRTAELSSTPPSHPPVTGPHRPMSATFFKS
jgi:hypothetical protein